MWRGVPDGAPWRDTDDLAGAPSQFVNGRPVQWVRGWDETHVDVMSQDGSTWTVTYNPDGSSHHLTFDADGKFDSEMFLDAAHEKHRVDGPAVIDSDGVFFYRDGYLGRDPDEGPAAYYWDGTVQYDGVSTPQQRKRHGVIAGGGDGTYQLDGLARDAPDPLAKVRAEFGYLDDTRQPR